VDINVRSSNKKYSVKCANEIKKMLVHSRFSDSTYSYNPIQFLELNSISRQKDKISREVGGVFPEIIKEEDD